MEYPPFLNDELFGRLEFESKYGYYSSKITYKEKELTINLDPDTTTFFDELFDIAKKFWSNIDDWIEMSIKSIIESSYEEINNDWLDRKDNPLTREEFIDKLILTNILIDLYSEIHLIFDIEGLSLTHTIIVVGTLGIGIEHVHLH